MHDASDVERKLRTAFLECFHDVVFECSLTVRENILRATFPEHIYDVICT